MKEGLYDMMHILGQNDMCTYKLLAGKKQPCLYITLHLSFVQIDVKTSFRTVRFFH
jgi:hypothetical protein